MLAQQVVKKALVGHSGIFILDFLQDIFIEQYAI